MRLLPFERRWLLCVFDAILPSGFGAKLPIGARDAPLTGFVDELWRYAPPDVTWGVRFCLWLVVLCPLFVLGVPRTFGALDAQAKMAVLEKLRHSPIYLVREIPLLFKMLGCLGLCGLPVVHERLGLEPRDAEPPAWAASDAGDRS